MEVFVLISDVWEAIDGEESIIDETRIEGVFSSFEKAWEYRKELDQKYKKSDRYDRDEYVEFTVMKQKVDKKSYYYD